MVRKIGILGGSFDPVHRGHIRLAEDALREAGLDCVLLIPAAVQPFKQDVKTASGSHRLNMLRIATENRNGLRVSDYEIRQKGVSYTYLTMRAIQKLADEACGEGEEARLHFITGTDAFLKIDTWMEGEELLSSYSYIVGTRPGYRQDELEIYIEGIRKKYGTEVINLPGVQLNISSTEVRERIRSGLETGSLLPEGVERYIEENELYI